MTNQPTDDKQSTEAGAGKTAAVGNESDRTSGKTPSADRREDERYTYRHRRLMVRIQQPGDGAPHEHAVEPLNVSKGGMSFLYSGFVHANSRCWLQLITLHGTWRDVTGKVVECSYIGNKMHEVQVRFAQGIEPSEYCRDAVRPRVLLVDDSPSIVRLAKVLLEKLNAQVDVAEDGEGAIAQAMANVYDVILMDINMPRMDGLAATKELRRRGYSGMIVAATASTQPEDRERCLKAGCDSFLPKPYGSGSLAHALEFACRRPIFSTLADDPSMAELVEEFVSEMPARIRKLEDAIIREDGKQVESLARSLKAEGASYGFEVLTELAAKIEALLIGGSPIKEAHKQIEELVKLCLQVRSSAVVTQPQEQAT